MTGKRAISNNLNAATVADWSPLMKSVTSKFVYQSLKNSYNKMNRLDQRHKVMWSFRGHKVHANTIFYRLELH
jgi:hypothetical protein